jgi:predicted cupin superfamily sugar epimerase
MMKTADYWIQNLNLAAHPEGGFFKETYRATGAIPQAALPGTFSGDRSFSTAIYFLLRSQDKSHFHRIKSDELWHFHAGTSLSIYILDQNGLTIRQLGTDLAKGEQPQVVIPANVWFGAMVNDAGSYTLAGCTVAPGFDFRDFEMATQNQLLEQYPDQAGIIRKLTLVQ